MKRWLVGFSSVSLGFAHSLAFAQGAPSTGPSTGAFPGAEPPAATPAAPTTPVPPAAAPAPAQPATTNPAAPAPADAVPPPPPTTSEPLPAPPPAAAPAAAPAPAPAQPVAPLASAKAPPLPEADARPIRERRPLFIGGELGWNGLSGLGVNFSYHPIPQLAIDTGLGLSFTGFRIGARARANFLTGEWTPFLGVGATYAGGSNGESAEVEYQGDKARIEVLSSPYLQLAGGVNYTGSEGFVFMATTGYAILLKEENTRFAGGSLETYDQVRGIYGGGLILSVAFGYAF